MDLEDAILYRAEHENRLLMERAKYLLLYKNSKFASVKYITFYVRLHSYYNLFINVDTHSAPCKSILYCVYLLRKCRFVTDVTQSFNKSFTHTQYPFQHELA